MRTDNPYQPPQTESTLIEPETPEIFVDGMHLVVASGVELPQRCVKTNEPVTDQDFIQETLQWRGRTLELMINVPECELRWYAAPRVRWRGRAAMIMMGMVLLVGGTLVLFFGLDKGWIQDPLSFAAVCGIVMIGAFMLFKAQHVLRVVDHQNNRFWIEGCCPEFLESLDKEIRSQDLSPLTAPSRRA